MNHEYKLLNVFGEIGPEITERFSKLFEDSEGGRLPVLLNFNSDGGDPREVEKILQMKKLYPGIVIGFIDNDCVARSAAFVLFEMVCDKRLVAPDALLKHKDMAREITIELLPTTTKAGVSEFLNKHLTQVKEKQLRCEDQIAQRCGITMGEILWLKKNGDTKGKEAVELRVADLVVENSSTLPSLIKELDMEKHSY